MVLSPQAFASCTGDKPMMVAIRTKLSFRIFALLERLAEIQLLENCPVSYARDKLKVNAETQLVRSV
jgi:hypothetical protein